MSTNLSHFQVRNPKDDETTIESSTQIFSSLLPGSMSLWKAFWEAHIGYAFEIYLLGQRIYFYMTVPSSKEEFVKSLITSSYPNSLMVKTQDPLDIALQAPYSALGEIVLSSDFYLPIKTYSDFRNIDPLSSVLGFLAKGSKSQRAGIQMLIAPATFPWQHNAISATEPKYQPPTKDGHRPPPAKTANKALVTRKTAFQGGKTLIRIITGDETADGALNFLQNLGGTFGAFSLGEGNQLKLSRPGWDKSKLMKHMKERKTTAFEHRHQILNAAEMATIWHPPGILLAGIKNVSWGKALSGEPPEDILIADELDDEAKKDVNFFATTEFKNKEQIFGISTPDRRKHVYIIGKTGAGKSTLIANMAVDDIRRGRGIGVIDPHGDLTEAIMDYIPKRRVNDVVYLEPFDQDRPFHLNILEVKNKEQKHLVISGIVSIFYKIYGTSWGPRLEYILRNVISTLLEVPGATLADALRIMSDQSYRNRQLEKVKDPVVLSFWKNEFDKMTDKLRVEAISPIQNKVGQFVTSPMIRNIIGHPTSTIDLAEIMDEGKILLLNLSQGKLGEDNAALLGAMFITRLQLAAMGRSFQKEEDRRDFFLYVDEFQNFATNSFIKILSEARKYRLSLTLANQYVDQLDKEVSAAIFGNVGTLMSFVVGSRDAYLLSKEYGDIYSDKDLVSLGKFEAVMKLSVNGQTSAPFPARTLPPPTLKNDNREKIIRLSKEKFGRKPVTGSMTESKEFEAENETKKEIKKDKLNHTPLDLDSK